MSVRQMSEYPTADSEESSSANELANTNKWYPHTEREASLNIYITFINLLSYGLIWTLKINIPILDNKNPEI